MKNGHYLSIILLTTAILPYVAVSCRRERVPEPDLACSSIIHLTRSGPHSLSHLNAFVYYADSTGMLDSYQSYGEFCGDGISVGSTSGTRRIAVTANYPSGRISYENIMFYDNLCGVICNLSDENPETPFMSGGAVCMTSPEQVLDIQLRPLLARVRISGLEVDFSGHPYRDRTLENIKAYLTNVNGRCPLVGEPDGVQSEIYNYGAYDPESCRRLSHPQMLFCDDLSLPSEMYCYPNCVSGKNPQVLGRAVTRLVIEGSVDGVTYYYPISIGENGVERGRSYDFDIRITSTGTTDPDSEAESGMVSITSIVKDWTEYDEEIENY